LLLQVFNGEAYLLFASFNYFYFAFIGCPFSFSTAKKKMDEKKTPAHFDFSQGKRNARPS